MVSLPAGCSRWLDNSLEDIQSLIPRRHHGKTLMAPQEETASPVVAVVNFKDWWLTVWFNHMGVEFPGNCACCGDDRNLVQAKVSPDVCGAKMHLKYPICRKCRRHAKIDSIGFALSLSVAIILPPVAYYLVFGLNFLRGGWGMMLALYAVAATLIGGAIYLPISLFLKRSGCADTSWPVSSQSNPIADSDQDKFDRQSERKDEKEARLLAVEICAQSGPTGFALQFHNLEYARELLENYGFDESRIHKVEAKM